MNHKLIISIPTDQELDTELKNAKNEIEALNRKVSFLEKMKKLNGAGRLALQLKLEELLWDKEHADKKMRIEKGDTVQITIRMEKIDG